MRLGIHLTVLYAPVLWTHPHGSLESSLKCVHLYGPDSQAIQPVPLPPASARQVELVLLLQSLWFPHCWLLVVKGTIWEEEFLWAGKKAHKLKSYFESPKPCPIADLLRDLG